MSAMACLSPDQIEQIATWLAATDIGALVLQGPSQRLVLRNDGGQVAVQGDVETVAPMAGAADATAASAASAMAASASASGANSPNEHPSASPGLTVKAASVGVFLHRHPLRHEALAAPGVPVQAGQALGLLQIGLLLLPVTAPAEAVVSDLLVEHGAVVGWGTPLVALQATEPTPSAD